MSSNENTPAQKAVLWSARTLPWTTALQAGPGAEPGGKKLRRKSQKEITLGGNVVYGIGDAN